MHEKSDAQLLRDYAERGTEIAFREIVERHADLIYSSALRQMASPDLARDVAQSVFIDLARKASSVSKSLNENASLLGWLYRGTRFAALTQLRDERRRHARERQIMEQLNPASETAPDWERIAPVLDEAMADLCDEDREALLLRFFKKQDFRTIGSALGVSDDAAQKRVSRAVERLREFFSKRNVTIGASGLAVAISGNAVQAAPIGFALTISSALAGTTLASAITATAIKTVAMTTLQKSLITAAIVAALGAGIYQAREASMLRREVSSLKQQRQNLSADQLQQLTRERDNALRQLADLREENDRLNRNSAELIRLRREVGRLRESEHELMQLKASGNTNPAQAEMKSWLNRIAQLKKRLEDRPDQRIPELQLLTEQDWVDAAHDKIETEKDLREALSKLRRTAENKFAGVLSTALKKYLEANHGKLPNDVLALEPYFSPAIDTSLLQRYEIRSKQATSEWKNERDWNISQKAPVDEEFDARFTISPEGFGSRYPAWRKSTDETIDWETLMPAVKAFKTDYGFSTPSDWSLLNPYVTTPEQKAALEKAIEIDKKESEKK